MEKKKSDSRWRFRFSLKTLLILMALVGFLLASYLFTDKFFSYKFDSMDYYVEKVERISFLDEQKLEVWVILEEGKDEPTLRQRMLIYKLKRYGMSLKPILDDAADKHRIEIEYAVGNLTEEYGLPVMNRQNIADHYHIGLIWIPRLEDSPDDFVVLGCDCIWEEEHGMEMLVKNGSSVAWFGGNGPWEWSSPAEFLAELDQ